MIAVSTISERGNLQNFATPAYAVASATSQMSSTGSITFSSIRGVNFEDPTLLDREGGYPPFSVTPPSVDARMIDLQSRGFNFVRVGFYWEAYEKNSTAFLNKADEIASSAQAHGINAIFCFFQWKTAYVYGGGGFPTSVTNGYPTETTFWNAYYNASTGQPIWDAQIKMMHALIYKINHYNSVVGYETLNEPHIYDKSQYAKSATALTYIDQHLRSYTNKYFVFDKVEPKYSNYVYVDWNHDPLTKPNVSKVIFAPHEYNQTDAQSLLSGYETLAQGWNVKMIIGEWAAEDQPTTNNYVSTFHSNSIGWIRYVYDSIDPKYQLETSNYQPDNEMTWLVQAMNTYH